MDFKNLNKEVKKEEITLRPISFSDEDFILTLFQNNDILKYYIVTKEVQQDYRKLVNYWLLNIQKSLGLCWIIMYKSKGFFSSEKACGFVAFEFKDTPENVRISYAIHPNYRNNGLATKSVDMVITKLMQEGVLTVEADIDIDNLASIKVVEKLDFKAIKNKALIDPEVLREEKIRMRLLWKKFLLEKKINSQSNKLPLNATPQQIIQHIENLVEEINIKGKQPLLMHQYSYYVGRLRFAEGDFNEARTYLSQGNLAVITKEIPVTHKYFYWLGRINKEEGKFEMAIDCFNSAIKRFNELDNDITMLDIENALKSISKI